MSNYYRMSTIVGVLFAAGWMQSARAEINDDQKIQYLQTSLEYAERKRMVPASGINHFQSWDKWNGTTREFKLNCAKYYENELTEAGMSFTSNDDGNLARVACRALDKFIFRSAERVNQLGTEVEKREANAAVLRGQYIFLSAIFAGRFQTRSSQPVINRPRQSHPEIMSTVPDDDELVRRAADFMNGAPF